jgi:hypothetical protein
LIGQFPSKFFEKYDGFVFRQSPSKFRDKGFDAGLQSNNFVKEIFDRVNGHLGYEFILI